METRFSHLYQRDSSVSMLRVRMARRRSQSQKENRDRAVNRLRRLDQLPELEASALDESVTKTNAVVSQGAAPGQKQVKSAVEERMKMLARYKVAKELQKEKERREKERKGGVFKVGLYKPQPLGVLPQISSAPIKAKTAVPAPSSRVTRSMKRPVQKPLPQRETVAASKKVEPVSIRAPPSRAVGKAPSTAASVRGRATQVKAAVCAATTRSASRSQTGTGKPTPDSTASASKTRAAHKQPVVPPGRGEPAQGKGVTRTKSRVQTAAEVEEMDTGSTDPCSEEEQAQKEEQEVQQQQQEEQEVQRQQQEQQEVQRQQQEQQEVQQQQQRQQEQEERKTEREKLPAARPSFAPQGFVFQAPSGLKCFQPVPLTPRSADAFLTPSYSVPPALSFSPVAPRGHTEPPRPCPSPRAPVTVCGPEESLHDVPYFRSEVASETARLSALCEDWEPRTEDPSIPEESRDRMRSAVGQARLLMKERFGQFQGLVDDCALGRGEKITTCTDLQGFWDMVYFQVEDVVRKFDALREAESRGWQEEYKPPPRPKKMKKPAPAAAAGRQGAGEASVAARGRLAAIKAAMKAKRAAAAPADAQPGPAHQTDPAPQTVVFHGGFFRVESPIRTPGSVRRSARRSAAPSLHDSPCPGSQFTTPARPRPSASARPSPPPPMSLSTPSTRTPRPLPQAQSSSPKPALDSGAPCGQSVYDAGPPVPAPADGRSEQPGTRSQPPEAAGGQSQALEILPETSSRSEPAPEQAERRGSQSEGVAEPAADSCALPFPGALQAEGQNSSLRFSPCQTALLLPAAGHVLSPALSPRPSDGAGLRSPPPSPASRTPAPCSSDSPAGSSEACMDITPDSSCTENAPGLDFERYLRPTLRCSPSPQAPVVAMEAASLLATPTCTDVLMDSPGFELQSLSEADSLAHTAQTLDLLTAQGPAFTQQTHQLEEGELLLFTPEPRDRVRQSVCERDLMTFTPPSGR